MLQKIFSNLSDTGKIVFNIAIGIVVLACADRLFLGPTLGDLGQIGEQISRQKISIINDLKFLNHEEGILKEAETYQKYLSQEVKDENIVNADFLSQIERLASQSKVNLVKSNPAETKTYKDYAEYYASLDCAGKLEDVINFIHAINSSEELLKVVRFNMTPKRGAENEINVSMTVLKMMVRS